MSLKIVWKGNDHTNSSSREGNIPFVIVDHISAGSMQSMDNWFTSPGNQVSSAHFGVSKKGEIHQYVDIERMAWAQGLSSEQIPKAKAQVVKDMGINPNLYCVSIEHEGHDGELTEAQFDASVWLHRYIQDQIWEKWQRSFPLDDYHVIGHHQVDPVRKSFCPGPKFPWKRLYEALSQVDREKEAALMEELRKQLEALQEENTQLRSRLEKLENLHQMDIPDWAKEAINQAVRNKTVLNPENGSYDFYRFVTILHRKGLL